MPSNIELKHLLNIRRFPDDDFKVFCLVFYLPVGIALFILRLILAFSLVLIGCSLSETSVVHKLVNKIACLALGITVTVENPDKKENVEVYVTNNVSIFDHLAIHTATGSVSPGSHMHPALARGFGIHYFGSETNSETFKNNITKLLTEHTMPIHFTPEDKLTNGRALLKFKNYPFALTNKVQPICIKIERPFLDIAVNTYGAGFWLDSFFFMFSPFTNYKLKFLPVLEKKSLQEAEFSEIVRQNLATALKVEITEFTATELTEWEKREVDELRRRPLLNASPSVDSELRTMASQVKEVLPHVPLNAIYKDLNKTRNVDNTITNILEGRVHYIPEEVNTGSTSSQPSTSGTNTSADSSLNSSSVRDLFNTAASSFAKSAQERNKSFKERKEQLIANARKRYIEKHNLNISF